MISGSRVHGQDGPSVAWRVLPEATSGAADHLARTQALLESVGAGRAPATVCFERWEAPAVILGASQRAADIDVDACHRRGFAVARRVAGGKAVIATSDYLSLTIVTPGDHALVRGDILAAYQRLGVPLVDALRGLGLDASLLPLAQARAAQAASPPSSLCYGGLSPYEITIGARKVIGVAQVRRYGAVAYVAGLYRALDVSRHAALVAGDAARETEARNLAASTIDLRELGAVQLFERLPGAMVDALAAHAGHQIEFEPLLSCERARQGELVAERYTAAAWTWRR